MKVFFSKKCYPLSLFRLANIVEGKVKQQFDKNGILFIDEDPKDFVYILRCLLTTTTLEKSKTFQSTTQRSKCTHRSTQGDN